MSETRQKPRVALYSERRAIEDTILAHSEPSEKDSSSRRWDEGWSFDRAAKFANPRLDAGHARRVARAMGLTLASEPPVTSAVAIRIDVLEQRVAALEQLLGASVQRIFGPDPHADDAVQEGQS